MNDLYGRKSIIAVQIVTSPSFPAKVVSSSLDSLLTLENITRSLECIDVEKLDDLRINSLSMEIDKFR